jgi:hypothetical protein
MVAEVIRASLVDPVLRESAVLQVQVNKSCGHTYQQSCKGTLKLSSSMQTVTDMGVQQEQCPAQHKPQLVRNSMYWYKLVYHLNTKYVLEYTSMY